MHRVVRENLKTLYAAAEDGFAGAALPSFVRKELEGYRDCAGVLGAAPKWRALVVPPPPSAGAGSTEPVESPPRSQDASPPPPTHRCKYRPWMELLRRTFAIDLETCERCGGRTRIIALVKDPEGIARFLRDLGLPTEPPTLSPARAPPSFQSRVLRRRPAEQGELFDG